MKKQLLFGSALVIGLTAHTQNLVVKPKPSGVVNMAEKFNAKFITNASEVFTASNNKSITNSNATVSDVAKKEESSSSISATTISWKAIAGSMNVYGQLVNQSRPLQYNDQLNAVSYIHRKSATYNSLPNNNSGAILAEVSTNWFTTWDSTCIWSSSTDFGRYPQGAIYNPSGIVQNTVLANAYIVASGPTTNGTNWTGNFYASKQLNGFNNTASNIPNAQQFLSITSATYPANQGKHGWSRMGFTSTEDNVVRSLALIEDDLQSLSTIRGASVVKGSFNAGVFNWTTDSIIPSCILKTTGEKQIFSAPQMVWNKLGTVGYVVFIGAVATATGNNLGWQPIVYKTTNSGATWSLINGINFNSPAYSSILNHIASINTNTAVTAPFFNIGEGFDCVVDANNKLHIASTIIGTASNHPDSLAFSFSFTSSINPNDEYQWRHTPGEHPYLYDFTGDGTGPWSFNVIDSLSSEGPSSSPSGNGFSENPWDNTGDNGVKVEVDARIQLGRTPDGNYITYSWTESDTNVTSGAKKWNNLPNIKTRLLDVITGSLSPTKINVSKVAAGQGTNNTNVANRATLHYLSQTTSSGVTTSSGSSYTVDVKTPFTVTNSSPYSQLTNNVTWFSANTLSYAFTGTVTGTKENSSINSSNINIFPNPAKNNATLAIDVKENSNLSVEIYNIVGALVKTVNSNVNIGSNKINLDLTNLNSGIYMANIKVGNTASTKKLIIE